MVSQETLLNQGPLTYNLFEEINPSDAIAGETKTDNHPPNEVQREVVTSRKVTSDFSFSVVMPLCVHGWENPDKEKAMSLMVFDYEMLYTKRNNFVKSVKMSFTFDEAAFPAEERSEEGRSNPRVEAYAPFAGLAWNKTEADVKKQSHVDAKIGANYGGSLETSGGEQKEISHTQKFFTRGQAKREYNNKTGKWDQVVWYLQQNESQRDGIPSTFSVAVLLERASNANFRGTLSIRAEAGLWENFKSGWPRFFSIKEDDPVNFDPQKEEKGQKWETYKDKISTDNLGLLARDHKLIGLAEVWGSDLGTFAPHQPS